MTRLVTGASGRIGRALCIRLAREHRVQGRTACLKVRAQQALGWRLRFGFDEVLRQLDAKSPEMLPPGLMPALPPAAAADPDRRSAARHNRRQARCL